MRHLLPKLMAILTQHPRHIIVHGTDFQWSDKSWTHNMFRLYEVLFGRRYGKNGVGDTIRIEMSSGWVDGKLIQQAHSLEASCALIETAIRGFLSIPKFKLVKVYIPQFAPAGGYPMPSMSPYFFAIAFDAALNNQGSGLSPVTWSHTVTGSNPNLLVSQQLGGSPGDAMSATTYNSVSMTKQQYQTTTALDAWIWYLGSPDTGSNTVSSTFTGGTWSRGHSISYSGCSSTIDNSGKNGVSASTSPLSLTITSVADNCWMVMAATLNNFAISAGTDTFERSVDVTFKIGWYDTNGVITPAGARSLQVTWTGTQDIALVGATIAPVSSASAVVRPNLLTLNVG